MAPTLSQWGLNCLNLPPIKQLTIHPYLDVSSFKNINERESYDEICDFMPLGKSIKADAGLSVLCVFCNIFPLPGNRVAIEAHTHHLPQTNVQTHSWETIHVPRSNLTLTVNHTIAFFKRACFQETMPNSRQPFLTLRRTTQQDLLFKKMFRTETAPHRCSNAHRLWYCSRRVNTVCTEETTSCTDLYSTENLL